MNELKEIQEELFCIRYETKAFAQYLNYGKIERWIPDFTDQSTEDSHTKRYALACFFTKGKKVLDIASGSGRGSYLLAKEGQADSVLGIDIDEEAIRYARHRYCHSCLQFQKGDATKFSSPFLFDVIVSFETVEHLPNVKDYFININNSLTEDGHFLISTPISKHDLDNNPHNKYHVREWGLQSFQEEVKKYLNIKEVYLQLYPYVDHSKKGKIIRLFKKLFNSIYSEQPYISTIYKFSDIPSSVKLNKLGNQQRGYQILVCMKK